MCTSATQGGHNKENSEEKRISKEANDVPKSTNESRAHYSPEPAWGKNTLGLLLQPRGPHGMPPAANLHDCLKTVENTASTSHKNTRK